MKILGRESVSRIQILCVCLTSTQSRVRIDTTPASHHQCLAIISSHHLCLPLSVPFITASLITALTISACVSFPLSTSVSQHQCLSAPVSLSTSVSEHQCLPPDKPNQGAINSMVDQCSVLSVAKRTPRRHPPDTARSRSAPPSARTAPASHHQYLGTVASYNPCPPSMLPTTSVLYQCFSAPVSLPISCRPRSVTQRAAPYTSQIGID